MTVPGRHWWDCSAAAVAGGLFAGVVERRSRAGGGAGPGTAGGARGGRRPARNEGARPGARAAAATNPDRRGGSRRRHRVDLTDGPASWPEPQRAVPTSAGVQAAQHQRDPPVATGRDQTGRPQSCWCTWQAGNSTAAPSSQDAARTRRRAGRPSPPRRAPESARARCPLPSPATSSSGRRRRDQQPRRRAVAVVELLARRRLEHHDQLERARPRRPVAAAGCGTRPARPASHAWSGSRTRVSRCAADSTTSRRRVRSAGPRHEPRRTAPRSPVASVETWPVSGSKRRTASLYVSSTATEPSGSTVTPSGCWSSASSAGPSRWPKSNSPCPTWVVTTPARTAPQAGRLRVGEPQPFAVASRLTARPDGCANQAWSRGPVAQALVGRAGDRADPARRRGSNSQSWWMPAIATTTRAVRRPRDVPRRGQPRRDARRRGRRSPASTARRSPATVVPDRRSGEPRAARG